jgi:hypothetical protein
MTKTSGVKTFPDAKTLQQFFLLLRTQNFPGQLFLCPSWKLFRAVLIFFDHAHKSFRSQEVLSSRGTTFYDGAPQILSRAPMFKNTIDNVARSSAILPCR